MGLGARTGSSGQDVNLQAGGLKDERMVRRYIRKLGALEGGMAQFFGRGPA